MEDLFIFILDLILTAAIYSGPIAIYRYVVKNAPVSKNQATKITVIYGLCAFVFMSIVIAVLYESTAGTAVLVWSFVNYYILTKPRKGEEPAQSNPPSPPPPATPSATSSSASPAASPSPAPSTSNSPPPSHQSPTTAPAPVVPILPPPPPAHVDNARELTEETYKRILSQFTHVRIKDNVEFELFSIMYIVADFALCSQKKYDERLKFSENFTAVYLKYFNHPTARQDFDESNDFYAQFLNGKEARSDFFPQDQPCTGLRGALHAFGDVLWHPGIKANYDNSGVFFHDFFEAAEFRRFFIYTVAPALLDYGTKIAEMQSND